MATWSTGPSVRDQTPARRYRQGNNPGYSHCMGIQLTDFHRNMIKTMADFRRDNIAVSPYLFGFLTSRVDSFVRGLITRDQLADDHAFMELLRTLDARCSTKELHEIASGTRELPGEDVQSGQ